ncbi:MAG: hypothetical protein SFV22_10570 [Saprospiraceae bacterium]|nr:hypothetical protein [Saprospiraceae bacterium]
MIRSLIFSALFPSVLLALLFVACKEKTTLVNGRVVDKHTGQAIDSAVVVFRITSKDDPYNTRDISVYSDHDGRFYFESELSLGIYWVIKEGYLQKGVGTHVVDIEQHKMNDIVIEMIPKDGFLSINCINSTGSEDTLYLGIYSGLQDSELGLTNGVMARDTVIVGNNSTVSRLTGLASGETVEIYWDFIPLPFYITEAPNRGSAIIVREDTAAFDIFF